MKKINQKTLNLTILVVLFGMIFAPLNFQNSRVLAITADSNDQVTLLQTGINANETEANENYTAITDPNAITGHKIAYWWGKVNQHKVSGVWSTDPDGVSGANINKYDYCKKWFPTTQYAFYDGQELISGWTNQGNTGNYTALAPTYHCTNWEITADFETQKTLFKHKQVVPVIVGGTEYLVKIIISDTQKDYQICGDARVRFEVDGQYLTRFMCLTESDSITYDNERVKITLKNLIYGENQTYGVAEVTKEDLPITPTDNQTMITANQFSSYQTTEALTLIQRLKGRILLQVEGAGQAYYINPVSKLIYYLSNGSDAFNIMRNTGLGISESDYNTLISNTYNGQKMRERLMGKIILRVHNLGQAYYINPATLTVTYMANGNAAYNIMRNQSLGISNDDLATLVDF